MIVHKRYTQAIPALLFSVLFLRAATASAQLVIPNEPPVRYRTPIDVDEHYLETVVGAHARYMAMNQLSDKTNATLSAQVSGAGPQTLITSIPTWTGSAPPGSLKSLSFTMAGGDPSTGGTTSIDTSIIPISFVFDGFKNAKGNPITLDVSSFVPQVLAGPNFNNALYSDAGSPTQFADAVQLAEFTDVKLGTWHTLLNAPRMLTPVTIEIPAGLRVVQLYRLISTGAIFALVNAKFFISQLNTIFQLEGLKTSELAIALTHNVFLYQRNNPADCCILGFHSAFEPQIGAIQTFAWASWTDPGIFYGFKDITAFSHEVSEWMDDPFVDNAVTPPWQFPHEPGVCRGLLETGDPIEVLRPKFINFPVTLNSFTYHPQNEALLQWFAQTKPSDAFEQAYSYPNNGSLLNPSKSCP